MGNGKIQLQFEQNDVVMKSAEARTFIAPSSIPTGTIPTPIQNWIAQANAILAEIPEDINSALAAAKASGEFDGDDGVGIASIAKTGTSGLVDTYTITLTDGSHYDIDVTNGTPGQNGVGIQNIAKTSTVGLVDTYTITLTNGQTYPFTVTNGQNGVEIDDTTPAVNKVFSSSKVDQELTDVKTAIQGVSEDVQELSDDVSVLTQETDFIHNLLGKAGQFSPSTSWYRMWGCSTYSASDGIASFLCSNQYGGIKTSVDIVVPANHKIYAFAKLKGMGARLTFASSKYANSTSADEFNFVSFIESWSEQLTRNLQIVDISSSNFQTLYAKECGVIDLTATFGDVVPTKAQLDAFVTQVGFFENFPVGTFLRKFYTDYIKAGENGYPNLGDKTIVIMGDSITMQNTIDGNGNLTKANTNWPDYAMPLLGDPTVYNLAQDGSPYHDFNGSGTYQTFTKQYNLMVSKGWNPDIIILAFGTNDYQYTHTDDYATAMNIYSLSGLDKTNNYQCIRWAYWTLTQNYPNALIIVGTPVARADIGLFNWVREAIIQMGQTYELNIVDCMTECGIIRQYENGPGGAEGRYLADGLHPNTKGKKLLGRYWAYKIAQLFSPDKFDKTDVS